jgi:hypothetical protein
MRHKIAVVPLAGNADTGGGIGAWQNPEDVTVIVYRLVVYVPTPSTGACTVDAGTTTVSASTSGDNLIDGLSLAVAGVFDNLGSPGTNGKAVQTVAPGKWITFSRASGASAGFVGTGFVHHHRVS